ncbi:hypothetical protein AAFF_G00302200 [Aldrovandia affinis]|uniref:Ig-like domain-containing protein n=1 Tax=Aldrovandia affinis TaxID=143900 RepID=A0AAD7R8C2_9TELE|nr:hypothetical protein AAFF_G00302200 [Aldrovandia affinis]
MLGLFCRKKSDVSGPDFDSDLGLKSETEMSLGDGGEDGERTPVDTVDTRQGDTVVLGCQLADGPSRGAWLNHSSILFAGDDKWSADPRVSLVTGGGDKQEYSLRIERVQASDEGRYTCLTQNHFNPQIKHMLLSVRGTCLL